MERNGGEKLRYKDVVKRYAEEIEKYTVNLLEIPNLFFTEIMTRQTFEALKLIKRYGLLPRDAIHAFVTLSGTENLITTDDDFAKVPDINVYTCNPKTLKRD